MSLADTLLAVWRQALAENADDVKLNGRHFPVRRTPKKLLRQVDFYFGDEAVRGLEQNSRTSSVWARLAREGHRVMQFLSEGRYIANVVDGKVTQYGRKPNNKT
jgi:hypothetical protein